MAEERTGWGGTLWAAADLVTPMAIRVAATLRLADHIAAGTCTAEALAAAVDADPDALARLLAHLVTAGVLIPAGADTYGLTGLGSSSGTTIRPGCGPGSIWRARSAVPTCASSSCCTPSAPPNRPSRADSAGRTGKTSRPTPSGPHRSTR